MTRYEILKKITELRERAQRIAQGAEYADSNAQRQRELAGAAKLMAEADALELLEALIKSTNELEELINERHDLIAKREYCSRLDRDRELDLSIVHENRELIAKALGEQS